MMSRLGVLKERQASPIKTSNLKKERSRRVEGIKKLRHSKTKEQAKKDKRATKLKEAKPKGVLNGSSGLVPQSLEELGACRVTCFTQRAQGLHPWLNADDMFPELQHEPVQAELANGPKVSLKRLRDETVEFKRPSKRKHLFSEEQAIKRQKLVHVASDEHSIRFRQIKHLSTSFVGELDRDKPQGFVNPHNFCYRRSVMQSFVNNPLFVNWLGDYFEKLTCNHVGQDQTCVLCTMWELVDNCNGGYRGTQSLVKAVDRAIRNAPGSRQHDWTRNTEQADANELLLFLIQALLEQSDSEQVLRGLFQSQLFAEWTCDTCSEVSTSSAANETALSIAVPAAEPKGKNPPFKKQAKVESGSSKPKSLRTSLAEYFAEEVDDVKCTKCGSKKRRAREFQINAAPAVLFVHLKRFEANMYGVVSKNSSRLALEETIDLGAYLSKAAMQKSGAGLKYRLASVVAHKGSLKQGHYITYGRDLEGEIWRFDDEYVDRASLESLLQPRDGFTPYILTYIRV